MRVIGLISGTSVDGIDAALVEISGNQSNLQVELIQAETYPYSESLRSQILAVCADAALSMADFAALDDAIAVQFAEAALRLQGNSQVELIGSHGQTVYHRPPGLAMNQSDQNQASPNQADHELPRPVSLGYSLQLGRGALIAHLSQITTVSNFRAADIALSGHGAPMVPAVDACLLRHESLDRCIQNIGGIGNLTYLPAQTRLLEKPAPTVLGWDTGPGNALLDLAVQQLSNGALHYDQDGAWAAQGKPCQELVQQWLQHDFFQQPPPKSTGRELFGPAFLNSCWADAQPHNLSDADLLATLTELTAASIVDSYQRFLPQLPQQVVLCGGGSRNTYLKQRLQRRLQQLASHLAADCVCTTDDLGLSSDFKEAIAFAVLAYWRYQEIPGNLPEVTGAIRPTLLGEIHQGSRNTA